MKSTFLSLLFLTCSICAISQNTGEIMINANFWDANTGIDLKSSVFIIEKGRMIKIKDSDKNQKLTFQLPTTASTLVFLSEGYNKVEVPLSFSGKFEKRPKVNFSINTLGKLGNINNCLIFCSSETGDKESVFQLYQVTDKNIQPLMNITNFLTKSQSFNYPLSEQSLKKEYLIKEIFNGQTKIERKIYPGKGLNFIDLDDTKSDISKEDSYTSNKNLINIAPNSFGVQEIFFEQSKYDLNDSSKNILDKIYIYLTQKINSKIMVKGFTDNIGDKNLNTALAEYRAKVVANYLIRKGIVENRIKIYWEKDAEKKTVDNHLDDLSKYRKVVVNEIPE